MGSHSSGDKAPISLDDPPAGAPDGSVVDLAWAIDESGAHGRELSLDQISAYDRAARAESPGAEEAARLAEELPANADGERPVVSNVGYYLPYPGDPQPYRAIAWVAIASVPAIFVACLVVAGRRFYRARLEGPIAAIDEAARRISASDLDFSVEPAATTSSGASAARSRPCAPSSSAPRASSGGLPRAGAR